MSEQDRQSAGCVVELRCAPLPFLWFLADHYWFVVLDEAAGTCHRWEVWQSQDAGGVSFGHVHCDLKEPDAGVGGGPSRAVARWSGSEAAALRGVLQRPEAYPHCYRYSYWPGPNSNTFAAWVLREAGIDYRLEWRAIGRDY